MTDTDLETSILAAWARYHSLCCIVTLPDGRLCQILNDHSRDDARKVLAEIALLVQHKNEVTLHKLDLEHD